jgi:hypothetical protein
MMSKQEVMKMMVPALPAAPRGAAWAAQAGAAVLAALRAVWRALEAQGNRRAARALREAAGRYDAVNPDLARRLREAATLTERPHAPPAPASHRPGEPAEALATRLAREAAEVRELAFTQLDLDPQFAADLFAAADRHERARAA